MTQRTDVVAALFKAMAEANQWEEHADPPAGDPVPRLPELTESLDRLERLLSVHGKPWARENVWRLMSSIHSAEESVRSKLPAPEELNPRTLKAIVARFRILVDAADRVGRFAAMAMDRSIFPPLVNLVVEACHRMGVDDALGSSLRELAADLIDKGEEWLAASILKAIAPDEEHDLPCLAFIPLLDSYLSENPEVRMGPRCKSKVQDLPSGKKILALEPAQQLAVLRDSLRALERNPNRPAAGTSVSLGNNLSDAEAAWLGVVWRTQELRKRLVRRDLPFGERELAELFIRWPNGSIAIAEKFVEAHGLGIHLRSALEEAPTVHQIYDSPETGKPKTRIEQMLARPGEKLVIKGESPLKEAISQWLDAQDEAAKPAWGRFLRHADATDGKSQPTDKWLEAAGEMVAAIGADGILDQLRTWAVEPGLSRTAREPAGDILKAMVWLVAERKDEGLAPFFGSLCEAAYRKVPGIGPGAVPLGNACIDALCGLSSERAIAELVRLKSRVKFRQGRKKLDEALDAAADRAGLTVADLEEIALPTFGLDGEGRRTQALGDVTAEIRITGSDEVALSWIGADGKPRKSAPAGVKATHADDLKALRAEIKDIKALLAGHRWRLEKLYLADRFLPLADWRARYLEHPLMANPARRLIWNFDDVAAIPVAAGLAGVDGTPVEPADSATVSLWHPIQESADNVLAWRDRLATLGVVQPFKQAHREVYRLTDAERETRSYSNRFAAHFLYQAQLNALLRARGWTHQAIGWDRHQQTMPRLVLPNGLGAAVFGVGRVDMGVSQSGADLYVASQRVRFEDQSHTPIDLEDIPPLVFSEVMRDVDLFVGVSSIGNNPDWQDVPTEGRFRDYWWSYNKAELAQSAIVRRSVLEDLLPKLKIAGVCELDDRFLKVRGTKRTYKIHIGSGNILMEPNDQFLCIMADHVKSRRDDLDLRLPFEGDGTLSLILSKAFLLAADDKITDETILSQIGKR